jgi:hypothetical protein
MANLAAIPTELHTRPSGYVGYLRYTKTSELYQAGEGYLRARKELTGAPLDHHIGAAASPNELVRLAFTVPRGIHAIGLPPSSLLSIAVLRHRRVDATYRGLTDSTLLRHGVKLSPLMIKPTGDEEDAQPPVILGLRTGDPTGSDPAQPPFGCIQIYELGPDDRRSIRRVYGRAAKQLLDHPAPGLLAQIAFDFTGDRKRIAVAECWTSEADRIYFRQSGLKALLEEFNILSARLHPNRILDVAVGSKNAAFIYQETVIIS